MVILEVLARYDSLGLLILRVAIGIIFIVHALPKLKTPERLAQGMGWKNWQAQLLGAVELLGAISVIFGILPQAGSIALACVMLGAAYLKINKWKVPFTAFDKTGWEFDLILLAANLAIILTGGGIYKLI